MSDNLFLRLTMENDISEKISDNREIDLSDLIGSVVGIYSNI